ncbi:Origin of replication complex subunit 6 [Smittium culicis]|uniref:Origin of replication complex subunit 6 n=1 Tax=Smittium culicis TaxID=133412 RepID=A0A1R1X115_9FUNG|nr:Origin of replication complex subunit 6 [Smittium culicis]
MNNVISDILSTFDLQKNRRVYNKSLEFYNVIKAKVESANKPELTIVSAPISVQLACEHENVQIDKSVLVRLSAYPEKTYNAYLIQIKRALNIKSNVSVSELCIKFGVNEILANFSTVLLADFKEKSKISDDFLSEPVYILASFQIICNAVKKVSKSTRTFSTRFYQ